MSRRWTSLPDLGAAAGLIVAEAMWFALVLNSILSRERLSVGLLAIIGPAALAFGCAVAIRLVVARRWLRLSALVAAYAVLTSLLAGLIAVSIGHSEFAAVAFHPWDRTDGTSLAAAVTAWVVAGLVCGRGLWLGATPTSFRAAVRSSCISLVTFVALFITFAADHARDLRALSHSSLAMFLVFLVFSMTALVLARQSELERGARQRASNGARWARFGGVAAAAAIVALGALLVALALGPAAPTIGRGTGTALDSIGHGIAWLWHHIPRGQHTVTRTGAAGGRTPPPVASGITLAALCLVGLVILGLLAARVRRSQRLRRRRRDSGEKVDVVRDSVFSWRHLFEGLRDMLRGLLRRGRHEDLAPVVAEADEYPDLGTVRGQYRRFLAATSLLGVTRAAAQTPSEFERHVVGQIPIPDSTVAELETLTRSYEAVRYGGVPDADLLVVVTATNERVVADLGAAAEHAGETIAPSPIVEA